jgi:hypothetical protein
MADVLAPLTIGRSAELGPYQGVESTLAVPVGLALAAAA